MSFSKILVAIDNSPLSEVVFAHALDLATYQGSSLLLFHCVKPDVLVEPVMGLPMEMGLASQMINQTYQAEESLLESLSERGKALLQEYCQVAAGRGVSAQFVCQVGEIGYQLCEEAKNWQATLIMVGREGKMGLAEAFMGSVSNYVVHHAPCSVLVIQPPQA